VRTESGSWRPGTSIVIVISHRRAPPAPSSSTGILVRCSRARGTPGRATTCTAASD